MNAYACEGYEAKRNRHVEKVQVTEKRIEEENQSDNGQCGK